jgi:hypothetical protein
LILSVIGRFGPVVCGQMKSAPAAICHGLAIAAAVARAT